MPRVGTLSHLVLKPQPALVDAMVSQVEGVLGPVACRQEAEGVWAVLGEQSSDLLKPRLSWAIPGSCGEFLVAWEALALKTPQYSQLSVVPRRWR